MAKHFWYCDYCIHRNQKKFGKVTSGTVWAHGKVSSYCEKRKEYLSMFEWCDVGKFTQKAINAGRPRQIHVPV